MGVFLALVMGLIQAIPVQTQAIPVQVQAIPPATLLLALVRKVVALFPLALLCVVTNLSPDLASATRTAQQKAIAAPTTPISVVS